MPGYLKIRGPFPPSGGTSGYFIGGQNGGLSALADKLIFSTEATAAATTANLSSPRHSLGGGIAQQRTKAYASGGFNGVITNITDKITLQTSSTAAAVTANLSSSRSELSGVGDTQTKGFMNGGTTQAGYPPVVTSDKITFSSDTSSAVGGANLTRTSRFHSSIGATSKGYFSGGATTFGLDSVAAVDIISFSTETTAASGNVMPSTRMEQAGLSNGSTRGYVSGGRYSPSGEWNVSTYRVTFSTDVWAAVVTADIIQYASFLAAFSDGLTNGYWSGGLYGATKYVVTNKIVFATEVTSAKTTANLTSARAYLTGIGDMGY